jgi:hypothetical protein
MTVYAVRACAQVLEQVASRCANEVPRGHPSSHRLEPDDLQRWGPVIEIQLAAAARRLADALNDALESPK